LQLLCSRLVAVLSLGCARAGGFLPIGDWHGNSGRHRVLPLLIGYPLDDGPPCLQPPSCRLVAVLQFGYTCAGGHSGRHRVLSLLVGYPLEDGPSCPEPLSSRLVAGIMFGYAAEGVHSGRRRVLPLLTGCPHGGGHPCLQPLSSGPVDVLRYGYACACEDPQLQPRCPRSFQDGFSRIGDWHVHPGRLRVLPLLIGYPHGGGRSCLEPLCSRFIAILQFG